MKRLVILFIVLISLVLVAGCQAPRTRLLPVQNEIYGSPSLASIERSIVLGASNAGWAVDPSPGVVYAAFRLSSRPYNIYEPKLRNPALDQEGYERPCLDPPCYERNTEVTDIFYTSERVVYVTISYNANNYRIEYADSKNMGFDPESDSIQNIYSQLVEKLDRSIRAELTAAY